jgi:aspartokinase
MAFFGSKVLFAKMIDCCEQKNIPIEVRKVRREIYMRLRFNFLAKTTLEKDVPFTLISERSSLVAAVSCIQRVAVIIVSGSGMKGVVGTASKVFQALKEAKVFA